MESENFQTQPEGSMQQLKKVTPLSKYLAMALFIILPFIGGYVGYVFAPEKVVEVEKIVEVEKDSVEVTATETVAENEKAIVSQLMWYWRSDVMASNVINVYPYLSAVTSPAPALTLFAPEGWTLSVSESDSPEETKTLQFTDPELPGKPDSDAIGAHIAFNFLRDTELCLENSLFNNKTELQARNQDLSTDTFVVYDTGWQVGWAKQQNRYLCIEPQTEYGEVITVRMYPITDENQASMEELLTQFVL